MKSITVAAATLAFASTALAQIAPTWRDVAVGVVPNEQGGDLTLRMNIYRPPSAQGDSPVVMWIHGGGWTNGSYSTPMNTLSRRLYDRGITVATIGYRLNAQGTFPDHIHDVKGAVRFLRANADLYQIDPSRIGAWGSSAGGHLTALLATSHGVADAEGTTGGNLDQSSRILAAVDYYGPSDILQMQLDYEPPRPGVGHDLPSSPESVLIGFDQPGQGLAVLRNNLNNPADPYPFFAARARLTSPITHIDPFDPVMFIAHGTIDGTVPVNQSRRLRDALVDATVPVELREVVGAGHGPLGTVVDDEAAEWLYDELTRTAGDATRDGVVDFSDLVVLARNYNTSDRGWRQGDFTGEGTVNFSDLILLARNYSAALTDAEAAQLRSSAAADWARAQSWVPEPVSLTSFAAVGLITLRRSAIKRRSTPT